MITLPEGAHINSLALQLIDFGGWQVPVLGGEEVRIDRLGARFAASMTVIALDHAGLGRVVVSRLQRAVREGMRVVLPLVGSDQGAPGAGAVVNGAGQAGFQLALRGVAPGWQAREGFWLSVLSGGRWCLYNIAADAVANGAGQIVLTLTTALRTVLPDGAVVELRAPVIEGRVIDDAVGWAYSLSHHTDIGFTIREVR